MAWEDDELAKWLASRDGVQCINVLTPRSLALWAAFCAGVRAERRRGKRKGSLTTDFTDNTDGKKGRKL
jgi:hypothetical protein